MLLNQHGISDSGPARSTDIHFNPRSGVGLRVGHDLSRAVPKRYNPRMGKLSALKIRSLKEPGRYVDGDGLMLQIGKNGGRSWLIRVQSGGRRRDIGLGNADDVSLAEAREKASIVRKQARAGLDPVAERKRAIVPSFKEAAGLVHSDLRQGWKNGKHTDQWLTTLELYAFPKLGARRVDDIEGPAICEVLAPIWLTKPETARRVKQRIGVVLDWAYAKGFRPGEAPLRSVAKGLPRQPRKQGHFNALQHQELPSFLQLLRARRIGVGRLALEFLILTAARSGEVRGARWDEIDETAGIWTIPAGRMKAGVQHRVPLSGQTIAVLAQARTLSVNSSELVFPGLKPGQPMSDMTLLKLLREIEAGVTVHGFRSTFRDWVAEETDYPREVAEAALAHTLDNKVEAAYRRTDFFEKRRSLMGDWADFCSGAEHG